MSKEFLSLLANIGSKTDVDSVSSGRIALWKDALAKFKEFPIFGCGFYACSFTSFTGFMPGYYHNTPLELLGTCGILGLVAYLCYRVKTILIVIKDFNIEKAYIGLMILGLILTSLLDNNIFNIYPCFFYAVGLALCEYKNKKSTTENLTDKTLYGETDNITIETEQ